MDLDLEVLFDSKKLKGVATLSVERADAAANVLVLDTRDLTISSVEGSGDGSRFSPRTYEIGPRDAVLGSPLVVHTQAQDRFARIEYSTSPEASGLQWLDPVQTASGRFPYLFSQSQEIHARSWIPLQDSPGVRVTFSARVKVPPKLRVVMGADRDPDGISSGREFRMTQPIPAYLIALAVGEIDFCASGPRTGVYAEPSVIAKAEREFGDTERMLHAAERLYGPYRWGRYDLLVLPPSFPFGGMEIPKVTFVTPTLIAGDKSLVSLLAHELAHSWSGNLVTNATWSDFWLNEGFTTYIEHRIVEEVYGKRRADMEEVLQRQQLDAEMARFAPRNQVLHIELEGRDPDEGSTLVPYHKGALFLRALEDHFGRPRFDQFLKEYFDHFAFQSITTAQALDYLREKLFGNDSRLVESLRVREWIYEPGLPETAPRIHSSALASVEQRAREWLEGSVSLEDIRLAGWSEQEVLHFLDSLPADLDLQKMRELDRVLDLTSSTNNERLQRWLLMAVRNRYRHAYPALERFLRDVGRRKYVKPLYEELVKSPETRDLAVSIYADARPRYHPITQAAVDAIIGPEYLRQPTTPR